MGSQGSKSASHRPRPKISSESTHSEMALADIIRGNSNNRGGIGGNSTKIDHRRRSENRMKENKKTSWQGNQTTYNLLDLMNGSNRRASEISTVDLATVAQTSGRKRGERQSFRRESVKRSPKKRTRSHSPRRGKRGSPRVAPAPRRRRRRSAFDALHKSAGEVSVASDVSNLNLNTKIITFNDTKESLFEAHLTHYSNLKAPKPPQFMNKRHLTQLNNHHMALEEAKKQVGSDDWEQQVKALEIIAFLATNNPHSLLKSDLKQLVKAVIKQVSNLRSQVSRVAVVTMRQMYINLQKNMEIELGKCTDTLISRAADTNKFIREGSNEALDAMCERVTLLRALESVLKHQHHKNVVVRATVARLVDKVTTNLGAERVFGASEQLQDLIVGRALLMLLDPSLEVRTHAKHAFSSLVRHAKFEAAMKRSVSKSDQIDVSKAVESIRSNR